ncbi:MAG: VWA domain-containing protein, partial [candidate division WOR-3 bacterium]
QLKEVLLLILRTLFIFFLLFSLTRPYIKKNIGLPKDVASNIIILDDSYSMAYGTNFKQAVGVVKNLIEQSHKNSEIAIILSSLHRQKEFTKNHETIKTLLDSLTVSYSDRTLSEAFDKSLDWMTNQATYNAKNIYIITDLQKHAIEAVLAKIKNLKRPADFRITVIDVGTKNTNNALLSKVYLNPNFPSPNFPSRLYASVKNQSLQSENRKIFFKLWIANQESLVDAQEKEITLNPIEEKIVMSDISIEEPAVYRASAMLTNDALSYDDQYYFSVHIAKNNKILLLTDNAGDVKYVEKALKASLFETEINDIRSLAKLNLKNYSAIGLFGSLKLNDADLRRIANYLLAGGGVFVASSEIVSPANWQKILNLEIDLSGKQSVIGAGGFVSIQEIDYQHPIMEIFKDANLSTAKFYAYWDLNTVPHQNVIAYFSFNKPFLIHNQNPKVIFALSNLDVKHTDFVFKATFVPLLHRIFSYLSLPNIKTNYLVDEPIIWQVASALPVRIKTPYNEYLQTPIQDNTKYLIKINNTEKPGFYHIGESVITVNVNYEESDLTRISVSEIKKSGVEIIDEFQSPIRELTNLLLWLAIIFFIFEMLVLII